MSFDELMQHAYEIQQQATLKAFTQHGVRPGVPDGLPQPAPRHNELETRRSIEGQFADIPEVFRAFAEMPDPQAFEARIEKLDDTLRELSSGWASDDPVSGLTYPANRDLDKMLDAKGNVERWTGRAAMEFKNNFISPFRSIVYNQFIVAAILRSALDAEREIWVRARNDIDKIAHDTLVALDRMDDCGKNSWVMTFTVVSSVAAVAGVALAPFSGGASFGLTAVGAASQVAAAGVQDDPPKVNFQGETAIAVIASMRDAIGLLHGYIAEQERKIADALTRCYQQIMQDRDSFVAKRPALADATAADVTGPLFMGYVR
jgi:predicted RNase H-like HicB family nuclease